MKTLFEQGAKEEIFQRVEKLTPVTQQLWGKMDASKMLAHCSLAMETAIGTKQFPRSIMSKILGPIFKKSILGEKPFSKNSPTDPNLVIRNTPDFSDEKQKLTSNIDQFVKGGEAKCTTNPHSFFGKMTATEWSRLMYKHLDHHFNQFGI